MPPSPGRTGSLPHKAGTSLLSRTPNVRALPPSSGAPAGDSFMARKRMGIRIRSLSDWKPAVFYVITKKRKTQGGPEVVRGGRRTECHPPRGDGRFGAGTMPSALGGGKASGRGRGDGA